MWRGGLCKEVVFIKSDHEVVMSVYLSHLCDLITKWSLYGGGLYKKVVFKRWPLYKGFTLGYIYMI